ncbi:hypothetical protein [Hypericibacter sp.]|uniref:hypothetical protein n=1 Tax=Hypericibacter sp. TaxID=2705401 RepID=UPI003D6D89BE
MKVLFWVLVAMGLQIPPASATDMLHIDLVPDATNPRSAQMGDNLIFHTQIRNDGAAAAEGLIVWISLIRIDQGAEQPVDLEDWSAQKAVTAASLAPGQSLSTDWPMRLIQAGSYRVLVSATSRNGAGLVASPFADFTVRQKPVVESNRVLPIAIGLPLLIAGGMIWQRRVN